MTGPAFEQLAPGVVVRGPLLSEPVEVITTIPMGDSVKLVARGLLALAGSGVDRPSKSRVS